MYLLTKCAACAAPLETGIKRCSRCKTRYCSAACQRQHWRRGGHKLTCEIIASRGGAARVLGDHHPLTATIRASIELCFAEQLDWTLDDFSADLREVAQDYL